MRVGSQRVLSVATRTERVGCVVMEDGDLMFWQGAANAGRDPMEAGARLARWVRDYRPDIIVSQDPNAPGRKHGTQVDILRAFARVAGEAVAVNLVVRREHPFENVYVEAQHLAAQFPDLQDMTPEKPPIWRKEPYRLVFFEALALVRDAGLLAPFSQMPEDDR